MNQRTKLKGTGHPLNETEVCVRDGGVSFMQGKTDCVVLTQEDIFKLIDFLQYETDFFEKDVKQPT